MEITFDATRTPVLELAEASSDSAALPFVTIGPETLTYAEVNRRVGLAAGGLLHLGVATGDRVVIVAPNCLEAVIGWLAAQAIGAIDAPISVDAPGAFLSYLLDDLRPKAVIGTPSTLAALGAASEHLIELAVVIDATETEIGMPLGARTEHVAFADLGVTRGRPLREVQSAPGLPGTIMYSSGTTGPSKGVVLSQGYYSSLASAHVAVNGIGSGSRVYCVQPLCHIDARSAVIDALRVRGHIALGTRFSASRYWDEVEAHDADVFLYVGTMIHLIFLQPERPLARAGRRRTGMGSATPPSIHRQFETRFGVELVEGYGMTELGLILGQSRGATSPGHIGTRLPWVDIRVVDDRDQVVKPGESGQLLARPDGPHLHMLGYWNRPEATLDVWRGMWFHTGDIVRERSDGTFEFVGRLKDSIRRRGENVSAWEVEEAANRHPGVREAAAIGVPSSLGEEDVALLVVPAGDAPDPECLRRFMAADLPRHAVPRFVEFVDDLPKTPSERIAKGIVRERGITSVAYDAERPPS